MSQANKETNLPKRDKKKKLTAEEEKLDDQFWQQKYGINLESDDLDDDEDYNIGDQDELQNDSDNYDSDFIEQVKDSMDKEQPNKNKDQQQQNSQDSSDSLDYQHSSNSNQHIPSVHHDANFQERMKRYGQNLVNFCYVRPIHFELLINDLERVDQSYVNYQIDNGKHFKRSGMCKEIINNQYFQIPSKRKNDYIEQDVPDVALKLFKSEDEKYQIDNELQKLQLALKLLEQKQYSKVNQIEVFQKYDILGNPVNESQVSNISNQIKQRINDLSYVRTDFIKRWQGIDKMYYQVSLDYQLYNQKVRDCIFYGTNKYIDQYFQKLKVIHAVQKKNQDPDQVNEVVDYNQLFKIQQVLYNPPKIESALSDFAKEYEENEPLVQGSILPPSFIYKFSDEKSLQITLMLIDQYLQLPIDNVQQNKYLRDQFQNIMTKFLRKKPYQFTECIGKINSKQFQILDNLFKTLNIPKYFSKDSEKNQNIEKQHTAYNFKNYEKLSSQFQQLKPIEANQFYEREKYYPMVKNQSPQQIYYNKPFFYLEILSISVLYEKIKQIFGVLEGNNISNMFICKADDICDPEKKINKDLNLEQIVIELLLKHIKEEISDVNYQQICKHFGDYVVRMLNIVDLLKQMKKTLQNIYSSQFDFKLYEIWKNYEDQNKYKQYLIRTIKQFYKEEELLYGNKSVLCRGNYDEVNNILYFHQIELFQLKVQDQIVIEDNSSSEVFNKRPLQDKQQLQNRKQRNQQLDQQQNQDGGSKNKQNQVIIIDSDQSKGELSDDENEEDEEEYDDEEDDEEEEEEQEEDNEEENLVEEKEENIETKQSNQQTTKQLLIKEKVKLSEESQKQTSQKEVDNDLEKVNKKLKQQ